MDNNKYFRFYESFWGEISHLTPEEQIDVLDTLTTELLEDYDAPINMSENAYAALNRIRALPEYIAEAKRLSEPSFEQMIQGALNTVAPKHQIQTHKALADYAAYGKEPDGDMAHIARALYLLMKQDLDKKRAQAQEG